MRLGASFCRPQAEDTSGEAFRAGHLFPKIVTVLMCEYPGVPEAFHARFPVSVSLETAHEKPLAPRVFTHKNGDNFGRDTDGCLHYTG